jgi:hypothetical protein
MIQIWDSVKGEWVDKFSVPQDELENIVKSLEDAGFRVIIKGDGSMPLKPSHIHENIVRALLEHD